jgi:hypothetical protein
MLAWGDMFVWGDQVRLESPHETLGQVWEALQQLARSPAGIECHAALVAVLIEAGELVQGLADARSLEAGCETGSAVEIAAMALLARVASAVRASWESGFARPGALPEEEIRALGAAPLPGVVRIKRAEGFALYSLYPESYLEAATALTAVQPVRVIGIRSIGAPLAALVASVLRAPPPVTVRPVGDPPCRRVVMSDELAAGLLADRGSARFAVVDEGPGLSGSSFGAVADFLEDRGVAPDRIHFFASHRGPLARSSSSPRHRRRWVQAARHAVDLGDLLLHAPRRPEHRLEHWVADLVGEPEAPLEEISGGRWRSLRYAREADWPPSNLHLERRKFLLRASGGGIWLLKFVGLGREGARKLARARALHAAGFAAGVAGYRHGFLVEHWLGDLPSLDRGFGDRDRLVAQVGRYLGFRARRFPAAEPGRGAPLARLLEMARFNAALALGEQLARQLDRWAPALDRLERRVRRIETDNRPHAWEWLLTEDGHLLKTDALDHHAGHDLVGCQDVAWDIVGVAVELGLSRPERDRLCGVVEAESGRLVDPELLALLAPCYLALQLGDRGLATEIVAGCAAEVERLRAAALWYVRQLRHELLAGA